MSNRPHARPGRTRPSPAPAGVIPTGDFGLGLCLPCLGDQIAGQPVQPAFAISLVPMLWPPERPVGMVAVPACYTHVKVTAGAAAAPPSHPLIVAANGSIPA